MTPERWSEVRDVLAQAMEAPEAERLHFVSRLRDTDPDLAAEVHSLLEASDQAGDFLNESPLSLAAETSTGTRLGPYVLYEEIGRGGMGSVYRAVRDDDQFEQEVAIKLVRRGMDTEVVLQRFRYERQILAFLNHPNIARLLDGGISPEGRPYLVMEHIQGVPITQFVRERNLGIRQRLELFRKVCIAVEFAHKNLIVHRDIKPGNVFITAEGEPKLLDFGIAKIILPAYSEITLTHTRSERMLTPDYASPEQFRGEPINTATDIYSLGALLYELLSGKKAHQFRNLVNSEVERVICEVEPTPPSQANGKKADPALSGDLDAITLKALRKEPAMRYESVSRFREDIDNYLQGKPVSAQLPTFTYRSRKFLKRHWQGVLIAASLLITMVAGIAATTYQAAEARRERDRAQKRFNDVRRLANSFLVEHDALAAIPGGTTIRSQLVADALAYLDSLAQESSDDPSLQRELALAYEKMGDVQGRADGPNLGNTAAAIQSYTKSLQIREELVRRSDDSETRQFLISAYQRLGGVLKIAGRLDEGIRYDQKALQIAEELLARDPHSRKLRRQVAMAYTSMGGSLSQSGDYQGTYEYRRKALALYEDIQKEPNLTEEDWRGIALAHTRMGSILAHRKEDTQAIRQFDLAISDLQHGLRNFPQSHTLRVNLATSWGLKGSSLLRMKQYEAGLAAIQESQKSFQALAASDPDDVRTGSMLATSHYRMARAELDLKRYSGALAQMQKSLAMRETLAARNPVNVGARGEVAESLAGIGDIYVAMRQPRKALDQYGKAEAILVSIEETGKANAAMRSELSRVRQEKAKLAGVR